MQKDLKAKLNKRGGFLGSLVSALTGPLLGRIFRSGKGMRKNGKSQKKIKCGPCKSRKVKGGSVNLIGSRGGAVKLIGERPRCGNIFGSFAKNAIKLGANFLKNKIQDKILEKRGQYQQNPMLAIEDARKAYTTGKDIYTKVKSGGKLNKMKTFKVKTTRRRNIPHGMPSTITQATTGVVYTRKLHVPQPNLSIAAVRRKANLI